MIIKQYLVKRIINNDMCVVWYSQIRGDSFSLFSRIPAPFHCDFSQVIGFIEREFVKLGFKLKDTVIKRSIFEDNLMALNPNNEGTFLEVIFEQ